MLHRFKAYISRINNMYSLLFLDKYFLRNRGRTVFFNGGNDDNLYQNIVLITYNSFKSNVCQINVTPF